jgi:hypothetical protein
VSDDRTGLSHDLPEYTPNVPPVRQAERAWKPRTALMVGGPADGQWRTVEAPTVEVTELPRIEWKANVAETTTLEPKRHLYHVDRLAMFGFGVWVAVCEREFMGSTERNKAVLRALLQRDVAREMGVL